MPAGDWRDDSAARKEGRKGQAETRAWSAMESQPAVLTYLRNGKVGGGAAIATAAFSLARQPMEWDAPTLTC